MGSAKERHDKSGHEKVQCRECNLWFHRIDVHVDRTHQGTDKYLDDHPGAPLLSERARRKAAKKGEEIAGDDEGIFKFGVARLQERTDLDDYDRSHVPSDQNYTIGPDESEALEALGLAMEDDENVLIVGPPGVGKSTLVQVMAACCSTPLRRFSFRGDMRASDMIGKSILTTDDTGQSVTQWEDGVLPDAAERGHWLLIDELDAAPAEVTFLLHPVLEDRRSLLLTGKNGGEDVAFDEGFRFIGTANTLGHGDESGQFAGTAPMNEALLDRFHTVIRMDYPEQANEIQRIVEATKIEESVAAKMVNVARAVREAQTNDEMMTSLSPRRLIMWANKATRMGDVRRASNYTVTNRLEKDDAIAVDGIIQRYFGGAV